MARDQTSERELLAANREQRILAQELHDTVCQTLAGVSLLVATALNGRKRGRNVEIDELERIKESLSEAVAQLMVVQQSQNLSLKPENLPEALRALVSSRKAVRCLLESDSYINVQTATIAQAIYRIARETLQNVARYEHEAEIVMRLSQVGTALTFEIAYSQSKADELSAYEGDGLLREFSEAVGLRWTVRKEKLNRLILNVSTGPA